MITAQGFNIQFKFILILKELGWIETAEEISKKTKVL